MAPRIPAVEYCPLDSLRFNPQIPRLHSKKQVHQIGQSIEAFGFNVPVLKNDRGQLIAGDGCVLIPAEHSGRVCAIGLDPCYGETTVRRRQKFTDLKAVHRSDSQFDQSKKETTHAQ